MPESKRPDLWSFNPREFEAFIAGLWEERGYETTVSDPGADKGIDVTARKDDLKELIQAKRYSPENKIGSSDIRRYATLYQQEANVDDVVIVTTSTFTTPARELGNDLDITLIDGEALQEMVDRAGVDPNEISVELDGSERGPIERLVLFFVVLFGGAFALFILLAFLVLAVFFLAV